MSFDFPASPTVGQGYTPAGGPTYVWDGNAWAQSDVAGQNRLVESFNLAGLASKDITVPTWNPSFARLSWWSQNSGAQAHTLRVSEDGTTFFTGATDYSYGGYNHSTGTNAFLNLVLTQGNALLCTTTVDHATIPTTVSALMKLSREGGTCNIGVQIRGDGYNVGATSLVTTAFYYGYPAAGTIVERIRGIRWGVSAGTAVTGRLTVEWLP